MSVFQNKPRSNSNFKAPIKNRSVGDNIRPVHKVLNGAISWTDTSADDKYNDTIRQADTVSLIHVFRNYGISLDDCNKITQCPFKFHNDNSPSFQFYPETNSFHCWGCKSTGQSVQLVSLLDSISRIDAANKLLFNFESKEIDSEFLSKSSEINDLYLQFSFGIRAFLKRNNKSDSALEFADMIAFSFDSVTQRHSIDDLNGLKRVVVKLLKKLEEF